MADVWLHKCVRESLDNNLLRNAVFLAERLYASHPSEARALAHAQNSVLAPRPQQRYVAAQTNALLLGQCYVRDGAPHRVVEVLQGTLPRLLLAFFLASGVTD